MDQHLETSKHVVNAASLATGVGSLLGWLPPIAALVLTLMGIGWYCVLYYDRFWGKERNKDRGQ